MTCLGVLERGDRDKNNETGLKEGGGIEMSIYSAFPYTRMQRSLSLLKLLTRCCMYQKDLILLNDAN